MAKIKYSDCPINLVPNPNYRRGYALEHRAKKVLEKQGWMVVRSPASRGAADLFAFKGPAKILVQCKKTHGGKVAAYGLDGLLEAAVKSDAKPLLVYSFYNHPVYAREVGADRARIGKNAPHVKLEDFLKNEEISYEHAKFIVE